VIGLLAHFLWGGIFVFPRQNLKQEGLAVARIVQDDPSPFPPEIPASFHPTIRYKALSVSSKDKSIQACKCIRDPLHPVITMHKRHRQTDWQTDGQSDIVAQALDVYITSRAKNVFSDAWPPGVEFVFHCVSQSLHTAELRKVCEL